MCRERRISVFGRDAADEKQISVRMAVGLANANDVMGLEAATELDFTATGNDLRRTAV